MSFWFDIDSSMILSHCGDNTRDTLPHTLPFTINKDNKLATALDTTGGQWRHDSNHPHWVWFDLGKPHFISSMRGLLTANTNIKTAHVYVGDDPADMGDAVLMVTDWQDYTPTDDYRYDLTQPKLGRYILLIIGTTTDLDNYLRWG